MAGSTASGARPASINRRERAYRRHLARLKLAQAQRLQRVEPELTQPFPVLDDPGVIPVIEQIAGGQDAVERLRRADVASGQYILCRLQGGSRIDVGVPAKSQPAADVLDQLHVSLSNSPQRGSKVGLGAQLVDVGPEDVRHVVAAHERAGQRQERDEPPRPCRQIDVVPVDEEVEAVEKFDDGYAAGALER